jgi:FtsX-like permease family protein
VIRDLIFGARFALAGGRRATGRLLLTTVSTALAVGALLLAASVPTMWHSGDVRLARITPVADAQLFTLPGQPITIDRGSEREDRTAQGSPLYLVQSSVRYHGSYVGGGYVKAGGPDAPVPPGLDRVPAPGEVYLSPGLAKLLRSPDGALLRPRFPQRVAGTIGDAGLTQPHDLMFYAGIDSLSSYSPSVQRVRSFGFDLGTDDRLPPVLWLLLLVGVVALLAPVLTVLGTAGRVGGLARERRLAALRLVGAGRAQTRRIAAGEALLGSLAGSALGVVLYLAGRTVLPAFEVYGRGFFSSDVRPGWPLAVVIVLLGPVLAVGAALVALRGAVIEPLGVVRQAGRVRRRIGWRLAPLVVGMLALWLTRDTGAALSGNDAVLIVAGLAAVLIGVPVVLPWLVERLIAAAPHGSVPYELAVRRLRLDGTAPARLVGGVAVVLAGAIALSSVMLAAQREVGTPAGSPVQQESVLPSTAVTVDNAAPDASTAAGRLAAVPGVSVLGASRLVSVKPAPVMQFGEVEVVDCALLHRLVPEQACHDGDVFLSGGGLDVKPGSTVTFADGQRWRIPATLHQVDDLPHLMNSVVATPGALGGLHPTVSTTRYQVAMDGSRDTLERVRNAVAPYSWLANVDSLANGEAEPPERVKQFAAIRKGLLAGALVTLLLAGASMVLTALEQVAERRRPLAVLAAVGAPRTVLTRSVLWQNLLPMAVALPFALATGLVMARLLLRLINRRPEVDWAAVGTLTGAAAVLVLVTTALTLPAVRQASRPSELRFE